jgi:hypothetical protein
MAIRIQLVNVGILREGEVLFVSDPEIANVLELAKFSMSFAMNLVRNSQVVAFIHEPTPGSMDNLNRASLEDTKVIMREHVVFKAIMNQYNEEVYICAVYPSNDDLKVCGWSNLTPEGLERQATSFLEAFAHRFVESTSFNLVPMRDWSQEQMLGFHQIMHDLFEETVKAVPVILTDEYPMLEESVQQSNECTFLFAGVMYNSIPVATRSFENMEGFFRITTECDSDVCSVIENLISAQLSTVISTSQSIAHTNMRMVELRVVEDKRRESMFITFFPIKNDFVLILIAKGSATTLRFFTEATASMIGDIKALGEPFTGEMKRYGHVEETLKTIPPSIETGTIDDVFDDIDLDIVSKDKSRDRSQGKKIYTGLPSNVKLSKEQETLIKAQREINELVTSGKYKSASRKSKDAADKAKQNINRLLELYYDNKYRLLQAL